MGLGLKKQYFQPTQKVRKYLLKFYLSNKMFGAAQFPFYLFFSNCVWGEFKEPFGKVDS